MELKLIYDREADASITDKDLESILRSHLYNHVCQVEFTKVNGETRTMDCTLHKAYMPGKILEEFQSTRVIKPGVVSVVCIDDHLEEAAWRAMKVENIKKIHIFPDPIPDKF